MLNRSLDLLNKIGIETNVYIPPFNTLDLNNYKVIKERFPIITGGPEAIPTIGIKQSPSLLMGSLYVPVYKPFYDGCANIVKCLRDHYKEIKGVRIIPLAIHWSWEVGSGFEHYRRLCEIVQGKTVKWNTLLNQYQ